MGHWVLDIALLLVGFILTGIGGAGLLILSRGSIEDIHVEMGLIGVVVLRTARFIGIALVLFSVGFLIQFVVQIWERF